jgi:2-polyprenyl-3-methyl-5-hydroxy-6-metoxy-1,4-benzoquinol methylase
MSGALFHPEQRVRSFDRTRLDALLTSEGFHLEAAFEIEPTEHAFASRPDFSRAFKEDAHVYFGNGNTLIAVARRSPLQARPTANKPASAGAFADRPAPDKGNDLAAAESWLKRRRLCSQSAEQETRPATRFDWTDDAIRSFWSHVAHSPLNDLSFGLTGGAEFVAIAKAWLKPGGRHLDIGAGEGHIADLLIAAGFPTAILEAAPERLIEIRAKLDGKPGFLGAIDDIAADAAHTFDVVLATEVIEHVTETAMASFFEMIGKALKPGGRLILTTPNNETLESMLVYSPLARVIFHRWQHLRSHDGEALCALLSRFGFEAEAVHEIDLASLAAGASPFFELLTSSRAPTRIGNGSNLFAVFRRQREMLALESHGTRV